MLSEVVELVEDETIEFIWNEGSHGVPRSGDYVEFEQKRYLVLTVTFRSNQPDHFQKNMIQGQYVVLECELAD